MVIFTDGPDPPRDEGVSRIPGFPHRPLVVREHEEKMRLPKPSPAVADRGVL
jgi:hypothetical protein